MLNYFGRARGRRSRQPLSAAARTAVGKECLPSPLSIADERNNSVDVGTAFSFEKSRHLGREVEGGREGVGMLMA